MAWVQVKLSQEDLDSFKRKDPYKFDPHVFRNDIRAGGKQYCLKCGLLALNNEFTSWAIKMGCDNESHSDYPKARHKYTKL